MGFLRQLLSLILPITVTILVPLAIEARRDVHVDLPLIPGFVFLSVNIAVWCAVFFALNTVYFIFLEEPVLEKRFGAGYLEYKKNVPRWIPRMNPWRPGGK